MSMIVAILVFGMIILIHEFGHFIVAKKCGIGVVEFSMGMGPRLCSVVKGETRYSVKALPFGGSCMMLGEDGIPETWAAPVHGRLETDIFGVSEISLKEAAETTLKHLYLSK